MKAARLSTLLGVFRAHRYLTGGYGPDRCRFGGSGPRMEQRVQALLQRRALAALAREEPAADGAAIVFLDLYRQTGLDAAAAEGDAGDAALQRRLHERAAALRHRWHAAGPGLDA